MKFFLVILLAGFAVASASPLYDLGQVDGFEEFADDVDYFPDGKPTLEVKEELKEKFDNLLQEVRDALKKGKDFKDEILKKVKEIKEKLNKDFLKELANHGRDYLKKIFEKLGVNDKRAVDYHVEVIMQAEEKDNMIQKLKDRFKEVVSKVKDAIEQGKSLKDGLETLEKIRQKLKDFNIDLGDFGNEYLEQLKDKVKDYWKKLKDRLGVSKRNSDGDVIAMVLEFKKLINEDFDPEKIKAFVEKYAGENKQLVEAATQLIRENGKESLSKIKEVLKKFIDHMISAQNSESNRNVFQDIRDFFKDLGVDIRDRFTRFGEWVREQYRKGMEKSKNRLQNIKNIAKEFLEDSRKISRDVAEEALQFFREYKNDLGIIFDDIEVKVKDILRQD